MGPLGFGRPVLWVGFVGPDRCMVKVLSDVPIGRTPDRNLVEDLMTALAVLLDTEFDPGTTVTLLLTRPGSDPAGSADHRRAQLLRETAQRLGVPIEPIHLANDRAVQRV